MALFVVSVFLCCFLLDCFVDFLQANWVLISLFALAAYAIDKLLKAIGFSRSNDSM